MSELAEIMPADDETIVERRSRALSLRNAGATFTQIAERCRISPAQARKDVDRARRSLIDESTRESLVADQRAVILDIRRANYAAMVRGDVDAAKLILSSLEREAKLFGLDAPSRSILGIGTDVEFAESLAGLIESVGFTPPDDLLFTARGERAITVDAEPADDRDSKKEPGAEAPSSAGEREIPQAARPGPMARDEWTNI